MTEPLPIGDSLVVTAVGKNRVGVVSELSKTILDYKGGILNSRMTVLGGEFAILLQVEGKWDTIARLESALPRLAEKLKLSILSKRTSGREEETGERLPYHLEVIALNHPGIVHQVADFFSSRDIDIEEMNTSCHPAPHTGAPMFVLNMILGVPQTQPIAGLRDTFLDFCDAHNLDGLLEPVK